ncbi:MAG: hypothetical protein QOG65_2396 [Actinomycetota bacterium]|jgi:hypothetical protein|nr:hypothetical protein [Actinomycetota bacterium]
MDRAELRELLDTGVAMLGVSTDDQLVPEAFRVWGATIDELGGLRALVSSDAGRTLAGLRAGGRLSFVFTDITTFRSVQVKGTAVAGAEVPGPTDAALMRQYDETFRAALAAIGHPRQLVERLRPAAVFVARIAIDELYDQTPGPGAGRSVGALRG